MKSLTLIVLILQFSCLLCIAQDQEKENKGLAPGMEVIKIGGANVLVPEGTKVTKKGGLIILESTSEYTGRKVLEIEERIERLESKDNELQEEITKLSALFEDINKKDFISQDEEEK